LVELEAVVALAEHSKSLEAACAELRPAIELPGVLRWVRRRVQAIRASLNTLKGLLPDRLGGCAPRLAAFADSRPSRVTSIGPDLDALAGALQQHFGA
jgi:hypothetical protein